MTPHNGIVQWWRVSRSLPWRGQHHPQWHQSLGQSEHQKTCTGVDEAFSALVPPNHSVSYRGESLWAGATLEHCSCFFFLLLWPASAHCVDWLTSRYGSSCLWSSSTTWAQAFQVINSILLTFRIQHLQLLSKKKIRIWAQNPCEVMCSRWKWGLWPPPHPSNTGGRMGCWALMPVDLELSGKYKKERK